MHDYSFEPGSGTRMEEALWGTDHSKKLANLRKGLANQNPADALTTLMAALRKYPTNAELLNIIPA
jgi:transcription termination factor Rho